MSNTTYNLSELIKTDCCIDCGTNEKLREVVGKMNLPPSNAQEKFGILPEDTLVEISFGEYTTYSIGKHIPLTSINIDL